MIPDHIESPAYTSPWARASRRELKGRSSEEHPEVPEFMGILDRQRDAAMKAARSAEDVRRAERSLAYQLRGLLAWADRTGRLNGPPAEDGPPG